MYEFYSVSPAFLIPPEDDNAAVVVVDNGINENTGRYILTLISSDTEAYQDILNAAEDTLNGQSAEKALVGGNIILLNTGISDKTCQRQSTIIRLKTVGTMSKLIVEEANGRE